MGPTLEIVPEVSLLTPRRAGIDLAGAGALRRPPTLAGRFGQATDLPPRRRAPEQLPHRRCDGPRRLFAMANQAELDDANVVWTKPLKDEGVDFETVFQPQLGFPD